MTITYVPMLEMIMYKQKIPPNTDMYTEGTYITAVTD